MRSDKRFEVVVPVNFSLVCFRLKPNDGSRGELEDLELEIDGSSEFKWKSLHDSCSVG